ncbi:hypothetical protein [Cryobacterium sp. BB307]|uniref:hypothetical protein n=1 Tax=Cryobacterium sp. BB307 TaxID=2716317 RepID=UPI0014458C84|nr:hypothetical protein [Cryobacterium sp. BB307]
MLLRSVESVLVQRRLEEDESCHRSLAPVDLVDAVRDRDGQTVTGALGILAPVDGYRIVRMRRQPLPVIRLRAKAGTGAGNIDVQL